ncbi:MAG: C40 family peptidase [Rubrivivax sp.]|nr:C40 family peptidase [Rubrivivax sp.]MBK7263039.1 C40 family peptidase [Rubrivivax sp.]MBK8527035.1 C40 family peptidase [Rubrivivax sp.]
MAQAAPGTQADTMLNLLQERGLLPAQMATQMATQMAAQIAGPTQDLVQQVRDRASNMVISAMNFLGVPYRRGGSSPEAGFDCSGFTRHIFEHSLGLVLPRRADEQARSAELAKVDKTELRPGDLVFFNTMKRAFSHVGIYVGDGKFIHSPRTGGHVRVEDMREAYWAKRYNGARRADLPALSLTADAEPPRP